MRAIYALVVPDILITGIFTDATGLSQEVPLLIIEFTEAVKTEDHELQRTYGAVAAMFANCFYVKIASRKEPEEAFGGGEIDPLMIPRAFRDKLDYSGFIHCEWETEPDNPVVLKKLPGFFGCPPRIKIFEETLKCAVAAFTHVQEDWFTQAIECLKQTEVYQNYKKCLDAAQSLEEKLAEWETRERNLRGAMDSLRFHVREHAIGAKIYRFGHAMDPDRGIVTFISALFSQERKVYGIYSLVRSRSDLPLLKEPLTDLLELEAKTAAALIKDEKSVPAWFEDAILEKVREAVAQNLPLNAEFDITDIILANKSRISGRVIATICYFLDGLYLNYNGLKLTWDRFKLLETERGNFLDGLRRNFGFDCKAAPLPVEMITQSCNEDEVTYVIVHRILVPNGFRVVSVSYPGAQGGAAVLPEPGKGKSQKRNYLDVVAFPPNESEVNFDVLLNENKGMFSAKNVDADIAKLKQYQNETKYKTALQTSLMRAKVISPDGELGEIVIGVGFGAKERTRTVWEPNAVDFIFRIKERTQWQIAFFRQDLSDLIRRIEGATGLPECYQVIARQPQKTNERKEKGNKDNPLFGKI
ncbi:MAG TPA: hypothetical protein VF596_05775 [Pyrinomonadaceae bacterium]